MSENNEKVETRVVRPPIVVVLGHVDHGKTSILDFIRKAKVAQGEAGGITQHIGAYQVEEKGKLITFLDTPGHEAFTAIRSRGAKVADIAILVVAADEGIKPQTKEAIQIIKTEKIQFIVAINKIDKEGSNPAKVRQELAENEVMVEDYGGTVPVVEVSARTGDGINHLLEMILLVAEMEELKAHLTTPAKGVVVESHMDKQRGLIATVVVLDGELKVSDWMVAGTAVGRAKMIEDFLGKQKKIFTASEPCVILGWETAPKVGQTFEVVASRDEAEKKALSQETLGPVNLFVKETGAQNQNKKIANLIVKTDVQSSLEAIDQVLRTIHSEEVDYNVVNYGVGDIGDADVKKATATNSAIIGFHVSSDSSVKQMIEREDVTVKISDIIYELVEGVREIMAGLLDPEIKRTQLGKLKILRVFKNTGKSQIVGGKVIQGKIVRGSMVDVVRGGNILISAKLGQLQHDKADVSEVAEGLEAGLRIDSPSGAFGPLQIIREGDLLDVYEEEKIKRTL